MKLRPCVVFSSGILGTGKTTTMKKFAEIVDNAFYMDRDDIIPAMLHVPTVDLSGLLKFRDYVENDGIFPGSVSFTDTPFGEMMKLDPTNNLGFNSDFYRRHIRDQSYLVQLYLARTNLDFGKVPVIDCITMRQIQDGTVGRFRNHSFFTGIDTFHFHFVVDEGECYRRYLARLAGNVEYDKKRYPMNKRLSREEFHKFVTEEQPMVPTELGNYEHLVIDTTRDSPEKCARKCIQYISK